MYKKIPLEIAIGIIIALVFVVGFSFWMNKKNVTSRVQQAATDNEQPITNGDGVEMQAANQALQNEDAEKKIIWKSSIQGDEVKDSRNPNNVCRSLQKSKELENCSLVLAKESRNPNECMDGMSMAGCFACKFECGKNKAGIANPASEFCVKNGGKSQIRTNQDGSQTGYCVLGNEGECEEWAYLKGECAK